MPHIGEHHGIAIRTLHHIHIFIRDSQKDLVIGIHPGSIRDLCHGTLIIQQIHSLRSISDSVILFDIVVDLIFALSGGYHKIHQQRGHIPTDLCQPDGSRVLLDRFQTAPGDLLKAAVNIHFMKSAVICQLGIRFQIFRQFLGHFLVV